MTALLFRTTDCSLRHHQYPPPTTTTTCTTSTTYLLLYSFLHEPPAFPFFVPKPAQFQMKRRLPNFDYRSALLRSAVNAFR